MASLNDMSVSMAQFIRQRKQGEIFSVLVFLFLEGKKKKESKLIMASTACKEQLHTTVT